MMLLESLAALILNPRADGTIFRKILCIGSMTYCTSLIMTYARTLFGPASKAASNPFICACVKQHVCYFVILELGSRRDSRSGHV
jgi:hypothetical protein